MTASGSSLANAEQQEFGREVPYLPGRIVACSGLDRKADDVGRPARQLPQIFVPIHFFLGVDGFVEAQYRAAARGGTHLSDPIRRVVTVESEGARAAEELGLVRHPEHRLESQSEPADFAGVSFGGQVGEHQCLDAAFVDQPAVVGAVQMGSGQANRDSAPGRGMGKSVRAVLHELEQLPVDVSAAGGVMLLVGVFGHQARLAVRGRQRASLPPSER